MHILMFITLMVAAVAALAQQDTNATTEQSPPYTVVSTACEAAAPDEARPSLDLRTTPGGALVVWVRTLVLEGRGTCGDLREEETRLGDSRWRVFQAD